MHRFSLGQRFGILKTYFAYDHVIVETARKLRTQFERNEAPPYQGIRNFFDKVRRSGMLEEIELFPRAHRRCTPEAFAAFPKVCALPRQH